MLRDGDTQQAVLIEGLAQTFDDEWEEEGEFYQLSHDFPEKAKQLKQDARDVRARMQELHGKSLGVF